MLYVAVAVLVQIEQHVSVPAAFQQFLDFRIGLLEWLIAVFDLQVQLWYVGLHRGQQRLRMGFQELDSLTTSVIEHQQALNVERSHPFRNSLEIEAFRRGAQLFDENDGRARGAAGVATASRKALDDREAETCPMRK